LSNNFEMKDIGELDVILNINPLSEGNVGVAFMQSHYMKKVLSHSRFSDYQPSRMPYDPSMLLRKNQGISRDRLIYSQIIGSLVSS
jgi:hypothetical protein